MGEFYRSEKCLPDSYRDIRKTCVSIASSLRVDKSNPGCKLVALGVLGCDMDGLDWKALKDEFSCTTIWKSRSWSNILQGFSLALLFGLSPSLIDVTFDGYTVTKFIHGDTYFLNLPVNDSKLNESDCTVKIGPLNTSINEENIVVECFQKDPIWGYTVLFLIFAPGLFGGLTIWEGLEDVKIGRFLVPRSWIIILTLPLFPVLLLFSKTIGLLNQEPQWKTFLLRLTAAEGTWESSLSFLLLLFYIFTDGDRFLSEGVFASFLMKDLLASLIFICKADIDGMLRFHQQPMEPGERLRKTILHLPLFLLEKISKLGLLAITATLLRYWFVAVLVFLILLDFGGALAHVVTKSDFTLPDILSKEKMITTNRCLGTLVSINVISIIFLFTFLFIWANVNPDAHLPGLFGKGHKFSDAFLVREIWILNISVATVVLSAPLRCAYHMFLQQKMLVFK